MRGQEGIVTYLEKKIKGGKNRVEDGDVWHAEKERR